MAAKLFNGKDHRLCLDQYGKPIWARTLRELRDKCGVRTSPAKQYSDRRGKPPVWTGYVVGHRWFTIFQPVEVAI